MKSPTFCDRVSERSESSKDLNTALLIDPSEIDPHMMSLGNYSDDEKSVSLEVPSNYEDEEEQQRRTIQQLIIQNLKFQFKRYNQSRSPQLTTDDVSAP